MQAEYKEAVAEWLNAIEDEETLASVNHSVAEVDQWEAAHFEKKKYAPRSRMRRNATKMHCA